MSGDCGEIEPPQTLKDALEFLAALNANVQIKKQVGDQLNAKAGIYFKQDAFYNVNSITSNFENVLQNSVSLRNNILAKDQSVYEKYGKIQGFAFCNDVFFNRLCGFMSKLNASLCYLLFNVDITFKGKGGGQWATSRCNDGGYFCEWLANHTGTPSNRFYDDKLLPGGYGKDELSSQTGNELTEALQSLVRHNSGGFLQKLLLHLLFLHDWYYSDVATVLAFIGAFCEEVTKTDGIFRRELQSYPKLNGVCGSMTKNISLITRNSASASLLVALYRESVENYGKLLKAVALDDYINELKTKLGVISNAITNVSLGCRSWNQTNFAAAAYSGPFPYGFMFGEAWKNGNWDSPKQTLQDAVNKLLVKGSGGGGSLQDLIDALKITSDSSEPGSDGPRKQGSSGTLSASSSTAGSSASVTPAHTSTNSEGTAASASPRSGESVTNSGDHSGQEAGKSPSGTPDAASESSVSGGSTVTIGGAAGGAALLGGGGAALYFLNVGGIKTLITGVP
ncbi:ribosome binding protein [Babesia caballi]|uniref:Ribosome binding protein n=1 Tax=Babesia caballi TaxID=5871 RepID=A0AAV4LLS3_BABCB|nr:ribosome binding protein [Babesia caballi]